MSNRNYRRSRRIKKKKSVLRSRFLWISILILIFILSVFYLCLFSYFFQIKEISISGNQKIESGEIKNLIQGRINKKLLFLNTKSIFLINEKDLRESIKNNYYEIEEIKINKKFPETISINIQERVGVVIFCEKLIDDYEEKCFLIDKQGVVFEEIFEKNKLLINFQEEKNVLLGKEMIDLEILNSILDLEEKIKTDIKISLKEILILEDNNRIDILTEEGWKIYIDLSSKIDWQILKLGLVLEKEIPLERIGDLEYIDVRIGDFAPYKYRLSPE